MRPLPIVGGAYADEARPWSVQDVCNWIPTQAESEGTRTPTKYATPPGLRPFVEAGSGSVRGIVNCNGRFFAVIGSTLYQISNTGVAIPHGTIPGVGRVIMAYNQITNGNELLVVNGSAGYVYNTVTETLARITDPGYPGAITAAFADGYLVQIEPGRRFAFHSDLADATQYNTLDRFTSEVNPDPLVGLAFSNNELFLLSTESGEFFENTGAAQQPFRSKRITLDKGCAGTHTIATMDNTVLWLGNDGKFYMLAGYTPQRISTRPIEQAIRGLNWAQAFAFVWEDSGHSVCYWTFPDGRTWGFDASSGKWHRRASYGMDRWRVNNTAFWRQQWVAGDFQSGRLWVMDWAYQLEGDQEIEREATTGVTHDNQGRVLMPRLEVILDMGQEPTMPVPFPVQPVGPQISGEAPDALNGDPYSFTYTTTPGDGAIVRTVLRDTTLPAGWAWDPQTATISHDDTPVPAGVIRLQMRVYDENGLYADHEDQFVITVERMLLVTGGEAEEGGPIYAAATALTPLDFQGIPVETGADLGGGVPGYYGGYWLVAGAAGGALVSQDLAVWDEVPSEVTALSSPVGSESGWIFVGQGSAGAYDRTAIADHPPTEITSYRFETEHPPGTLLREHGEEIYMASQAGGFFWMDSGARGELVRAEDVGGSPLQVVSIRPNGIAEYDDIAVWKDGVCAIARQLLDGAFELRRSSDGGETFPEVLFWEPSVGIRPSQIACNEHTMLVLSESSEHVWTSEDNFATPRETGVQRSSSAMGRQIVESGGQFFIIGRIGGDNSNCVCVATLDGITFSDPAPLPIRSVIGIAVSGAGDD